MSINIIHDLNIESHVEKVSECTDGYQIEEIGLGKCLDSHFMLVAIIIII